ncbi:sulfatase-like hydrolase/transferase [Paludisphaera mucosa]|uniref:Sulfatase-like hydrolase/transferase n=1 Tax=Paludisphaera mucosa TaxID=3030827 RepID=A0ABT6F481_9BACT|nr:sulfatase-like hydrolase/transferase [Paludisphaera mucosa]MDG3002306.1 sulfatase-like hydrolase/transferase [Paludisphaera mucosa]
MIRARITLALFLTMFAAAQATAGEAGRRPSILFLYSDDQRADTIAALGNPNLRTPNLDALTRSGTALTRAYCNGARQGAVCVPSRAMLLSGRGLFRVQEQLQGQDTWPAAFGRAGYATFATGKWHNGPASLVKSFQKAEAIFLGGMGDPYMLPLQDLAPDGTFVNKRLSGEHSVKLFADAASRFISAQAGDAPFLCYVAFNFPHDPRTAPAEYRAKYRDGAIPLPANYLPEHPFDNGELLVRDERLAPWPRTPQVVRRNLADYYASIEYLDAQVGRILDALRDAGRIEDTIVVYAGDHGLAIGSHGLFGKQNLYEHSMRSPVILAGPGVPAARKVDAFAYLHDLFPTLGELAGVAGPEGGEGLSLVPVFQGREPTRRPDLFTAYRHLQRAVRDDRWKLIVYPRINKLQLFDLQADPAELHDLASDPAHAREVARLTALLRQRQAEAGDDLPLRSEQPEPEAFDFSKVR